MNATASSDRRDTIRDTISRAVTLIDSADPADLAAYLAQTTLHDYIKADPAMLREHLVFAANPDAEIARRFGAWKAAQQLLQAAGLPY